MKRVPNNVITPRTINIYPTLSSPTALTKYGVPIAIPKFTTQFITTAIPSDLSCIISAIYNHVIGPDEISKNRTNNNNMTIGKIVFFMIRNIPNNAKSKDYEPEPTIISIFLPAFDNRIKPTRVLKKFTSPIRKVTIVGARETPLNKVEP